MLTTLSNYGAEYQVSFDMFIDKWSGFASVLHIGNEDSIRMPAVLLLKWQRNLYISTTINNKNIKYRQRNIKERKWYTVFISKAAVDGNVSNMNH